MNHISPLLSWIAGVRAAAWFLVGGVVVGDGGGGGTHLDSCFPLCEVAAEDSAHGAAERPLELVGGQHVLSGHLLALILLTCAVLRFHVVVAHAACHLGVDGEQLSASVVGQNDAVVLQGFLCHDVGYRLDDSLRLVGLEASTGCDLVSQILVVDGVVDY